MLKVAEKIGITFGYAFGAFDRDGPVGTQSGDGQRHGHAVVAVAADDGRADSAAADAHDVLLRKVDLDAQLAVLLADGFGPVAFLVDKPRCAVQDADTLGRGSQGGERGEEVGAVGGVELESPQLPAGRRDGAGFVDDRRSGPYESLADDRVFSP